MRRLTAFDEYLIHQTPEPLATVQTQHDYWRESLFFITHRPDRLGDMVILTMATYPLRQVMDSLQMGNIGGTKVLGHSERPHDGDPHTMVTPAARIEIVEPFQTITLFADPEAGALGMDLTFTARTQPYALRRGSMRAGNELIWDQSHMLQSGWFDGTYTFDGVTHEVDHWWGQRDHSWGIRHHARCPLWMWLQLQLPDGFFGMWHWEFANGAPVYSDGCWTPSDGGDPIDVLLVGQTPLVPGAVVRVRAIGALVMEDEAGGDEKLIAVPVDALSPYYANVHEITDLPATLTEQIAHFFQHYKDLEKGKWVTIGHWVDSAGAMKLIEEAMERAKK